MEPVRDQLLTRPNNKIGAYIEAIARRPVGACKIMITHIRCIEKMQLIQISLGQSLEEMFSTHPK